MHNSLLHLQFDCDRAAREFLAFTAWGFNKAAVREAVNALTTSGQPSPSAVTWLKAHIEKLPFNEEPQRLLRVLIQADAALRAHRQRPEAVREYSECAFAGRLRWS